MIKRAIFPGKQFLILTISGATFAVGNAQGSLVGLVGGTFPGSTITFGALSVANSLQLVRVSGIWQIQVGSSAPGVPTALTFNLVETLSGVANSPRTTLGFVVNEIATGGVLDFSQASNSALLGMLP